MERRFELLSFSCLVLLVAAILFYNANISPRLQVYIIQSKDSDKQTEFYQDLRQQNYKEFADDSVAFVKKFKVIENFSKNKSPGLKLDDSASNFIESIVKPRKDLISKTSQCGVIADTNKFDCYPEGIATEASCVARQCCWKPVVGPNRYRGSRFKGTSPAVNEPWCYYPLGYAGYTVDKVLNLPFGVSVEMSRNSRSIYPDDVMSLKMEVYYETSKRLRIKVCKLIIFVQVLSNFKTLFPIYKDPNDNKCNKLFIVTECVMRP